MLENDFMEYWDIYDIDRNKTNKTMRRGEEFSEGAYHLVVHVCLFNTDGKMLIQQRQNSKVDWPNRWDITVGGSALSGENSRMAAERELKEELGIHINFDNIRPSFTINFTNGFDDIYVIEQNLLIEAITIQKEEVQNAKWAAMDEIISMIDRNEFVPLPKGLIHYLIDLHKAKRCLQ
jgi:isopentenyldiphosphate isomerase